MSAGSSGSQFALHQQSLKSAINQWISLITILSSRHRSKGK